MFINGKLSGHSEQRSILTSRYLAINSLGVLSRFQYRLRVTELPDCVTALANGEIIVADNHPDIRRLKFFDCNQRYQRSLPLVSENHHFLSVRALVYRKFISCKTSFNKNTFLARYFASVGTLQELARCGANANLARFLQEILHHFYLA